jgi:hypothetical protein
MDLLNMQANVEAHGELFLKHGRLSPAIADRSDYDRFVEAYRTPGLMRVTRVFSYLNRLYRAPRTIGFKLMYTQLRAYPEILAYLAIRRIRVVHLTRRNQIDVIVSDERARITGTSHAEAGSESGVPMVHLDPATLVARIRRRIRASAVARNLIRLSTCPCLEVTYEALLEGEQGFGRIFKFLNIPIPAGKLKSSLAKRGSGSHRDSIANYDEVRQALLVTSFASMLR